MQPTWKSLIRQYRFRFSLTQYQLAGLLGVSQKTISRWESGENTPSMAQQILIRDLLREPAGSVLDVLRASVQFCPAPRALCFHGNLNLQAVSPPAIAKRPSIVNWIGQDLVPIADGVLADMLDDRELQRGVVKGEIVGVSAVTRSVLQTAERPISETYRTMISFFRINGILISDAISCLTAEHLTPGYRAVLLDEIVRG